MTVPQRKLLWIGFGLVLVCAGLLAVGLRSPSDAPEALLDLRDVQPVPEQVPSPQAGVAETMRCYLGVVVAGEEVDVVAETGGRVEELAVHPGDAVIRGQQLAALETARLEDQLAVERASLSTAQAQQRRVALQVDRADREHQRRLALQELISKQDVESSRFELDAAKLDLEVAVAESARVQARIEQIETELERCKIRAPFDGEIALRYVDAGAVVTPGTPMVRLIGSASLLARFAVPPEQAAEIGVGMSIRVEIETLRIAIRGVVQSISPEIDAATQMVILEASVEPPAGESIPAGAVARVSPQTAADAPSCLDPRPLAATP
jgi:RND family efflux transporter MFP subunit